MTPVVLPTRVATSLAFWLHVRRKENFGLEVVAVPGGAGGFLSSGGDRRELLQHLALESLASVALTFDDRQQFAADPCWHTIWSEAAASSSIS
jgi:hypothetical protein